MENQAYEDEPSTRSSDRPHTIDPSKSTSTTSKSFNTDLRRLRDESEDHVYEDIVVSELQNVSFQTDRSTISLPTNPANNNNNNNNNNNHFHDELNSSGSSTNLRKQICCKKDEKLCSPKPTISLSSIETGTIGNFRRNLTLRLPPSREIIVPAANKSTRSSLRTESAKNRYFFNENISSACAIGGQTTTVIGNSVDDKPTRRKRRKKDCKHCRNKNKKIIEISSNNLNENSISLHDNAAIIPIDVTLDRVLESVNNNETIDRRRVTRIDDEPIFHFPNGNLPIFDRRITDRDDNLDRENRVFFISDGTNDSSIVDERNDPDGDKIDSDVRHVIVEPGDDRALITPRKNRDQCMKVNSIYSNENWQYPDVPIFVTDLKEDSHFQRAYSLPTRTQAPSFLDRSSVRKSVRGEPDSHAPRLRKNRRGWTLDFGRSLDAPGRARSIILLLTVVLALLGIGGIALYIVFEPEKLQLIQQYLRSSSSLRVSMDSSTDAFDDNSIGFDSASTVTTVSAPSALLDEKISTFSRSTIRNSATKMELATMESVAPSNANVTRHCDDCYDGEVCVALVDEDVPFCRTGPDPLDPTGCAGLCLINKQKCHRLDVDAFRCVKVDNCLDDEWMCSNTLCIHLNSHCDGYMNCYDHSDEYDCACNLQTHFRCGNETSCLPLKKRCDGEIDCWDATDEINCTLACPSSGDFTCSNGECISKARFCDGLRDCTDGSDEPHGCQGGCNKHEFSCHNGRCITKSMRCNDVDDCGDNSDEQSCRYRI